ncbi:MAG: nucleotidyl transferase AbiEii/AbiGii toxin family protein [Candidatus Omnitrophica bacterium]|nr:nucleotidyl transferase AbiEii/AbiGii toxin family protein [Candidatus Omnitrophota bacterium]MBU4589853.1 nucleotidyl transferase AbiEii/AbiGii toxin family protein [Candidatus Omnitrophota bacterium]
MREAKIRKYQDAVLKKLSGRIDEFYLAGGTALSLFYFQHRLSVDLDFFTPDFTQKRVKEIVDYLKNALKKKIEVVGQNLEKDKIKILVYNIHFSAKDVLKIDFVEDTLKLIKPARFVEGIRILSLEDIYMRKLYAISGVAPSIDEIGRTKMLGGRIEAKDFYDLYFLSHTFKSLSKFINEYGTAVMIEGLVRWFRSYDRMNMMDGLLTMEIDKEIDCKKIEGHFKKEIDKIIQERLGDI